jgi:TrbL/VirB6 plasmid conjugal transfer protein
MNQGGLFLSYGRIELAIIAVFGLTGLALRWQLANLNLFHQHIHIAEIYEYLIKLAFISFCFTYYVQPIPGTGISLNHLFSEISKALSATLNTAIVGQLIQQLKDVRAGLEQPSFYDVFDIIAYYADIAVLCAIEVGAILMNAFGLAMAGLCALFGPLFMPLFLTKHFSSWFWRWIDNFFTYSMYRVVAIAITYLYFSIILAFFNTYVGKNYSLGHIAALFPYLLLLTWSYLFAIFKIPAIASMFFQGSGLSASGLTNTAIGSLVKALI